MKSVRSTTTRLAAVLAAAVLGSSLLAGCGNDSDNTLTPATRGPVNVSGQSTCVYIEVPAECEDSGVPSDRWFKAPDEQPPASNRGFHDDGHDDLLYQMFMFHVIYSAFYSSPYYVDHYVPVTYRDGYTKRNTAFGTRYQTQIRDNRSKATYRTASGKTVPGSKVDPKRFAPPKNAGGDRGKMCKVLVLEVRAPGVPKPPAPKAPAPNKGGGGDRGKGGGAQHGC